jgi:hypothetical protein
MRHLAMRRLATCHPKWLNAISFSKKKKSNPSLFSFLLLPIRRTSRPRPIRRKSINQNYNNPVAENQTRKRKRKRKKKQLPAIKPKQQKPSRPLNHSPEIIKPKQEKPKIRFKIRPVSVSRPDLLHV